MDAPLKQFLICFGPANIPSIFFYNVEVLIADNILKTFSLSYKHVILGCYIKDRSLKDVGFIIDCILFLCKFHIHKCKFTKGKPLLWCLKRRLKCI